MLILLYFYFYFSMEDFYFPNRVFPLLLTDTFVPFSMQDCFLYFEYFYCVDITTFTFVVFSFQQTRN